MTTRRRPVVEDDEEQEFRFYDVLKDGRRKIRRVPLEPHAELRIPPLRKHTSGPGGRLQFELQEIEDLASIGLSQDQIAKSLAVSRRAVEHRLATDDEFAGAYERGRSRMRAAIVSGIFHHAVVKQNLQAQTYLSKVHLQWRDGDSPNTQPTYDPAQIASAIRDQLNALNTDEGAPQ